MAIYVPGVPQYFPEFKPYTPDFKFLSNVLEARQQKYDTNFKALNDQYNRVVYGDLSRADTQEAREQFVNNLSPQLEKISGMDLSLAENVNAAQGVFAPFFQEEVIVKDLVYTKAYNNELQKAKFLRTAADENQRRNWWSTGDQKLQIDMQQFKNASREEALQMGLPKYVVDPDLYRRGMEYLKSQEYNVIKQSKPVNGVFFRVENKNGDNITQTALNDLKQHFKNDPIVTDGYFAQAYVDSMNDAAEMLNNNEVSSLEEGVMKWSFNSITEKSVELAQDIAAERTTIELLEKNVEKWQAQIDAGKAPIPGSEDDLKMQQQILYLQALTTRLNRDEETLADMQSSLSDFNKTGDPSSINSKAWQYLMTTNMMSDFNSVASRYSNIDKSTKYIVNEEEKQRRSLLNALMVKNAGKKDNTDDVDPNISRPLTQVNTSYTIDEQDGVIKYSIEPEDNVIDQNKVIADKAINSTLGEMSGFIAEALQTTTGYVEGETLVEQKIITEDYYKNKLGSQKNITIPDAKKEIEKLFLSQDPKDIAKVVDLFQNEEIIKTNRSVHQLINEKFNTIQQIQKKGFKAYRDNLISATSANTNYGKFVNEEGAELPFVENADGTVELLSKEKYNKIILDKIQNGEISGKAFEIASKSNKRKPTTIQTIQVDNEGKEKTVELEGYNISQKDFILVPTKAELKVYYVRGSGGLVPRYAYTSESFIPKGKGANAVLEKEILSTGDYKISEKGKNNKLSTYIS